MIPAKSPRCCPVPAAFIPAQRQQLSQSPQCWTDTPVQSPGLHSGSWWECRGLLLPSELPGSPPAQAAPTKFHFQNLFHEMA